MCTQHLERFKCLPSWGKINPCKNGNLADIESHAATLADIRQKFRRYITRHVQEHVFVPVNMLVCFAAQWICVTSLCNARHSTHFYFFVLFFFLSALTLRFLPSRFVDSHAGRWAIFLIPKLPQVSIGHAVCMHEYKRLRNRIFRLQQMQSHCCLVTQTWYYWSLQGLDKRNVYIHECMCAPSGHQG